MQSMLHAHPEVSFLPETHFFRHYVAKPKSRWDHERAGAETFRSTLARDEEYRRADISPKKLLAPFSTGARTLDVVEAHARLLQLHRDREDVPVVGEKDPRLIDYLPQVKRAFPEARIVHVVRDPRDVLLSRMNADWSAGRPDWLHVLTYRAQIVRGRKQGRRSFRGQYMELRYEDLLADPERVLREVTDHVGVSYSDAMLDFQDSAEELVDEDERSWKEETTGPLLRDNTGKWRDGLSAWQVCLTERLCNNAFEWFGYTRAALSPELSRPQQAALRLAPAAGTVFEYLYAAACQVR